MGEEVLDAVDGMSFSVGGGGGMMVCKEGEAVGCTCAVGRLWTMGSPWVSGGLWVAEGSCTGGGSWEEEESCDEEGSETWAWLGWGRVEW